MKNAILFKLDDIIECIKSDSCYLTVGDQTKILSKLHDIKKQISETYDFRMTASSLGK